MNDVFVCRSSTERFHIIYFILTKSYQKYLNYRIFR